MRRHLGRLRLARTHRHEARDAVAALGGHGGLQIIDDAGEFRGWVGVEASFYAGEDLEDPRESDMLGALRVTDFR